MGQGTIDGQAASAGRRHPAEPDKRARQQERRPGVQQLPAAQFSCGTSRTVSVTIRASREQRQSGRRPGSAPNPALIQVNNASNFVSTKLHFTIRRSSTFS